MSVNMQSLHEAVVAIVVTLGVALFVTIAMVAAGAVFERDRRKAEAFRAGAVPGQDPSLAEDAPNVVLR